MRKILKRIFAAVLAAALLFSMPGMAAYAATDGDTYDLELFGQKVKSGEGGDGWSYKDGVLTLENFHSESSEPFIHVTDAPLALTIYLKGDNSVTTSGILIYGNVRGSTTITGDSGASLSLAGQNWNDPNICIRGVKLDVTTQGMIFLSHEMVIDSATVSFDMSGSNGYIFTTHGGLTVENNSDVTITNASNAADYCVAPNYFKITDSTLNITNPSGFGVYVSRLSSQVTEYKASVTNSTITADTPDAAIHSEEEASVTGSRVTNSGGNFLLRSKKAITVDSSSELDGIIYEYFKSEGAVYRACGTSTLVSGLTVAAGISFEIPEGASLTIPAGVTLENNGTMRIHDGDCLTGAGALAGTGSFVVDVNEDMISIPEGLIYTGRDYTDEITLEGAVTVCGVQFRADTEGWTRSLQPETVKEAGDYTVTFTNGSQTISKAFHVAECPHTGMVLQPGENGMHTGICPACGYKKAEAHTIALTAEADNNHVITVHEACATCGYGENLGTVTIHIPDLVYGDLAGKVSAETTMKTFAGVEAGIDNGQAMLLLTPGSSTPQTMEALTGNKLLDAKEPEHKLKVDIVIDSIEGKAVQCELPFTVAPAPLTADMVTLDKTGFIYNGAEQKPALTVRHGQTPLTEGTDYEVSCFRGGAVTTDLTSAGTVQISVKGRGNYDEHTTVTKEYTITPATPVITWSSTTQELTYTGKAAAITAPTVTLADGGNFGGTISYSFKKKDETAYQDGLPENAGFYTIRAKVPAEGNYAAADSTDELALTIKKADAQITAGTDVYRVTYGDAPFTLSNVTDTNPEADVQYALTEGTDVISLSDRTVTVKKAGTATITVSLPETANYHAAENKTITVNVEKKDNAPNMPGNVMSASKSCGQVGEVALPEGWVWQETDRDTPLEAGVEIRATAVYAGADRGNYKNETVTVALTGSDCEHLAGGMLYTGTDEKAPTCTEKGKGHRECSICHEVIEAGIIVEALGHDYRGVVTKQPTTAEEGVMTYTCLRCQDSYTEPIARQTGSGAGGGSGSSAGGASDSSPDDGTDGDKPGEKPEEDQPMAPGTVISKAKQEKYALKMNAGLQTGFTDGGLRIAWGKVPGADGYDVYVEYFGEKFGAVPVKQIKNGEKSSITIKMLDGETLDPGRNIKLYVAAYQIVDGEKVILTKSLPAYLAGQNNKRYTNAAAVRVSTGAYTLKKGKTIKIKANLVLTDKSKKALPADYVAKLRYASSNKRVATVSKSGKVKAVGKGSCIIYVYAGNGYAAKVKVTVR